MSTWILTAQGSIAAPQLTHGFEAGSVSAAITYVEARLEFIANNPHYWQFGLYNEEKELVETWRTKRTVTHERTGVNGRRRG